MTELPKFFLLFGWTLPQILPPNLMWRNKTFLTKSRFSKWVPGGFEPETLRERQKLFFFLWSVSEFRSLMGGGGSRKSPNWSLKGLNCLGLVFVLIRWALELGLRSFSSFIFRLRDTNDTNDTNSLHYRSFEESLVGTDSIWTHFVYVLEKSKFLIFWQKLGGPLTGGGEGVIL